MFLGIIKLLMPFIKEMVLGNESFLVALMTNRKKLLFISMVFSSLCLNYITLTKLLVLSEQHHKLVSDNQKMVKKQKDIDGNVGGIRDELTSLKSKECPKYILPTIKPYPPLPEEELNKIPKDDTVRLSIVEKNYIIALREYIDEMRKLVITSYNDYTIRYSDTNGGEIREIKQK